MDLDWAASNPYDPSYENRKEHGFYVFRDDSTSKLSTLPISGEGATYKSMPNVEPVPEVEGKTFIAMFHTHPNPSTERDPTTNDFFFAGPSSGDHSFTLRYQIGGIIRSHKGLHYYGWPELK